MTKGTFCAAVDKIDLAFVSEAMNCNEKSKKTNINKSIILKIASVAACLSILVSVIAGTIKKGGRNIDDPVFITGDAIGFLFDEDNSEETVSSRCLSKTKSYFMRGDNIVINTEMGDTYTKNALDVYNILPTYNNADKVGYPILYVLDVKDVMDHCGDNYSSKQPRADSKMVINGSVGYYEKIFTTNDLKELDILDYKNPADYHNEIISIDFDGYREGDYGVLFVGFGWWFTGYNPYNQYDNDGSLAAFKNCLFYYVGANGIGLSYNCCEEAKLNLEKYEEIQLTKDESLC